MTAGRLGRLVRVPEPKPVHWRLSTWLALFSLVVIWACLFKLTWARWGNVTIDTGREMYVPAALSSGKTLYADVWYPYTPAAPYLNAALFRFFGARLEVLYWAGALAALSCAVLLYLSGLHLVSTITAWTVGTGMLIKAFQPQLFCFPLSYSFGAVYASVAACLFLWLVIHGVGRGSSIWIVWASLASAAAFLAKPEVGAGCFATLAVFVACRAFPGRSRRMLGTGVVAALPGVAVCGAVIAWMISLRGVDFLTQENLMSWPTSYFMQRYGKMWLNLTGLGLSRAALLHAIALAGPVAMWLTFRWLFARYGTYRWLGWLFAVFAALVMSADVLLGQQKLITRALFFPQAMLALAAALLPFLLWTWKLRAFPNGLLKAALALSVAVLIAARSLFGSDTDYGLYNTGTAMLAFVFIASWLMLPGDVPPRQRAFLDRLPGIAMLAAIILLTIPQYVEGARKELLRTDRGNVYIEPWKIQGYRSAIRFLEEHNRLGHRVLVLPGDTSLYFLAGVAPPARVYAFTPGVLAPGKMVREVISEIESNDVQYLIWSNSRFPVYGVPEFGVDFDQEFGAYLKTRFRPANMEAFGLKRGWQAVVWERIP